MGNILIIVKNTIVREALRHFLCPEYQTTTLDCWSAQHDPQSYHLAIVDREGLEQNSVNTAEVLRTFQRLKIPSVWLHRAGARPFKAGGLIGIVVKPLEEAVLKEAVRDLLGGPPVQQSRAHPRAGSGDEPQRVPGRIIELTEVVREPSSRKSESEIGD